MRVYGLIRRSRGGQAIMEIVLVSACMVAVLLVMQGYLRRGLNSKLKQTSDSGLSTPFDPLKGTYLDVHDQSGSSSSITRVEAKEDVSTTNPGGGEENYDVNYMVSYQIAGKGSVEGAPELTSDSRPALKEVNVIHTQIDMTDINGDLLE